MSDMFLGYIPKDSPLLKRSMPDMRSRGEEEMSKLINGRTPEEIKSVLCSCDVECKDCPYVNYQGDCAGMIECDALALIEHLEAQQPKWISVKERLPPKEVNILTVDEHRRVRILAFWSKIGKRWKWIENSRFSARNDITHWMPLPEPPEEASP